MRVRAEGIFKMHSEDDDYNLPITFHQSRHEPIESFLVDLMKNWRLKSKERVRRKTFAIWSNVSHVFLVSDENSVRGAGFVPQRGR
jgi:hypothetical protein